MLLYVIKRPYTKYSVYTERFTGTYKLYFLAKKRLHEKWSFPYKISSFFVQWKLKAISSFIVMMLVVMLNLTVESLLALFKMGTITWGFYHWMPWWTRSGFEFEQNLALDPFEWNIHWYSVREKCLNTEFFLVRIFLYLN